MFLKRGLNLLPSVGQLSKGSHLTSLTFSVNTNKIWGQLLCLCPGFKIPGLER